MIQIQHVQATKPRARFKDGNWFVRFADDNRAISHISGDLNKSLALVHRLRIEREQISK